jgi:xanthine dehydrogenase accessory factor
VLLRGGGDLGSGVALRLTRAGIPVVIVELPAPLSVRRLVSFSEAVYDGSITIESTRAVRMDNGTDPFAVIQSGKIPVLIDPEVEISRKQQPLVWVDARMRKRPPDTDLQVAPLVVGLGPGFTAGLDCHAVIETNRGPHLGRVYWQGTTEKDTGKPDWVGQYRSERVLRAPVSGILNCLKNIGNQVSAGELLAEINGQPITAPFNGVIRGLLRDGVYIEKSVKVGDLDPRNDPSLCSQVSDKSLSIAGGVLEAILSQPEIRKRLYSQGG